MRVTGAAIGAAAERDVRVLMHGGPALGRHVEVGSKIIVRGEGVYVHDDQGGRYLDAMSAMWCASLGYSEMRLVEAAKSRWRHYLSTIPATITRIFGNRPRSP